MYRLQLQIERLQSSSDQIKSNHLMAQLLRNKHLLTIITQNQ